MKLEHQVSYKNVKVALLYHVGNGKSLKDTENGLGLEEDTGRKIIVLIQVRNDSHLTKNSSHRDGAKLTNYRYIYPQLKKITWHQLSF